MSVKEDDDFALEPDDELLDEKLVEYYLDPKEVNDLLFLVQSLGCTKTVGNIETYVKSKECIEFLKELYKLLRNENPDSPLKRLELGEWNVVESDLLKLLVSYPDDRQLAFYTIVVLVSLTEKPYKTFTKQAQYTEYLQNYKLSFITSKEAIKVIVNHLAECLSKPTEDRNEQHDQMLELIIYLFRNLLAIPDKTPQFIKASKGVAIYNSREDNMKDLQRRFLHKLSDESILDAFIYMSQDFTPPSIRKLNLCFLEIFCLSLTSFSPRAMWNVTNVSLLQVLRDKAMQHDKERMRELASRHSKFGSSYKMVRKIDQVSLIYHNPFKEKIEINKVPGQSSRAKPQRKDNMNSLTANRNIQELARVDKDLNQKMKHFANELLEHSFQPLIESIFTEFYKDSNRIEDHDKTNYFLLQAFFMQYVREKFYAEKKETSLDVNLIAGIFQKMNFEYFFRSVILEFKKTARKEFNTRELHSSLKFCIQYFYIIKDLQSSTSEKSKKNAQILLQTVFYREISIICKKSFEYWRAGINDKEFLEDIVELSHITFKLLEEYSKGKHLTIRTERVRKSNTQDVNDEFQDSETSYHERQLNYIIEFSSLIEADIISKYCFLLQRYKDNREEVNTWVCSFIKKVVIDCEADWIFFQLEYLQIFDDILSDKLAQYRYKEIYEISLMITERFFKLFSTNTLLPVEALFRVREKRIKNLIVSNYTEVEQETYHPEVVEDYEQPTNQAAKVTWTLEEDEILLKNFSAFQGTASCYDHLANLLSDKTSKDIKKRVKQLKLEKGLETAKEILKNMHTDEFRNVFQDALDVFEKYSRGEILVKTRQILQEHSEFYSLFPGAEFAVVPKSNLDFDLFNDGLFCNFLMGLGLQQPRSGEWCWRITSDPQSIGKILKEVEDYQPPVYDEEECVLENGSQFLSQVMGIS